MLSKEKMFTKTNCCLTKSDASLLALGINTAAVQIGGDELE